MTNRRKKSASEVEIHIETEVSNVNKALNAKSQKGLKNIPSWDKRSVDCPGTPPLGISKSASPSEQRTVLHEKDGVVAEGSTPSLGVRNLYRLGKTSRKWSISPREGEQEGGRNK
jgi:hypothetical protein